MALKLSQSGREPLGQYDGLDTEVLTLKGGEIATFTSIAVTSSDKAAKDVFDGYVDPSSVQKRVVVTRNVATTKRPLMLTDDGIQGYGTLLGAVVGGSVGQQMDGPNTYTGAILGPHTATGSGKVTLWAMPGTYAVSLDAVDTAADGLTPSNVALDTGTSLTWIPSSTTGGQLTPVGSAAAAGNTVVVARFIEFETNNSLVTTPNKLVSGLTPSYQFASFYFQPPLV